MSGSVTVRQSVDVNWPSKVLYSNRSHNRRTQASSWTPGRLARSHHSTIHSSGRGQRRRRGADRCAVCSPPAQSRSQPGVVRTRCRRAISAGDGPDKSLHEPRRRRRSRVQCTWRPNQLVAAHQTSTGGRGSRQLGGDERRGGRGDHRKVAWCTLCSPGKGRGSEQWLPRETSTSL